MCGVGHQDAPSACSSPLSSLQVAGEFSDCVVVAACPVVGTEALSLVAIS